MESKSYPGIKNAIFLCLLLLGIQLAAGLIFGIILGLFELENSSLIDGIGLIIINLMSFGFVILIGFKKSQEKFNNVFFCKKVSLQHWIAIIVFMLGFVIISSELDNILHFILPMPDLMQDMFQTILVNDYIIISIISVGVIPAFVEEMLFRGVILNGFKDNYSPGKAIIISALLFGLIHLNPWQFLTAFIIGIITAWICLKTNSILPCIYIHLFNNMAAVLALEFSDIMPIRGFNTALYEQSFQPLWFNAIGIILTGIGGLLFFSSIKKYKL